MKTGVLLGIGVGPGDPELITLRGLRLLTAAPIVFVPATAPGRSYALTVASCHIDPRRQRVVELVCPPLRDRAALLQRWLELAGEAARLLGEAGEAVFLTEGDPSLYSTFQYLRLGLERGYPGVRIEVVPGVTSACAAAAAAGVPLAMWDERLAFVPGSAGDDALRSALLEFDTTVLLKPRAALAALEHTASGRSSREVTLVRRVGRPEEAIARGEAAARQAVEDYFSLIIVRAAGADGVSDDSDSGGVSG